MATLAPPSVDEDGSVLELQMLTHCCGRRLGGTASLPDEAHSSSAADNRRPSGGRLSPCPAASPRLSARPLSIRRRRGARHRRRSLQII